MPREVVSINTSHYRPDQERYVYRLSTTVNLDKATLSLHSFSMYNSTFNISQQLGNNKLTFTWIDDTVYDYTIEDGYFSIENLSLWLQARMIQDNLYVSSADSTRRPATTLVVDDPGTFRFVRITPVCSRWYDVYILYHLSITSLYSIEDSYFCFVKILISIV
jgi:hypothetical protein